MDQEDSDGSRRSPRRWTRRTEVRRAPRPRRTCAARPCRWRVADPPCEPSVPRPEGASVPTSCHTPPYGTSPYVSVGAMRNGVPSERVQSDDEPERPARPGRRTLSREDWARAALEAMREGGLGAVAVEPL